MDKINVDNLYSCDSEQNYLSPNERIKQIRDNVKIHTKHGNLVLFFDTENTGIPNNYDLPSSYTDNWPRMVQISWILMTDDGHRLRQKNYIIKPSNFTIPESSSKIHGITTEYAYAHGANLADVLLEFMKDFNHANLIVGHNISFDRNVVGAELIRQGLEDKMDEKQYVCTMKSTKKFCNLRSFWGLKYPKLQELHKKLFGYEFDDAHNAASDIEATQKCYWELKSKNIV